MFVLKDSEQLECNGYGQEDDTQGSNVAVGPIHPLGWIWNITYNKTKLNSHKLYEKIMIPVHTIDTKFKPEVDSKELILGFI